MRRTGGFTLIEVVIAMAIGVFVVLAVIGTVQSLSRAARTLEESGAEDEAWLRFASIFRRDVRGWMPGEERREGNATAVSDASKPFLVCQTTSDALFGSVQTGEQPAPRMATVRYLLRRDGEEFTIVRQEDGNPNSFTVPILHTKAEPKIEFFDGQRWSSGHQDQQLPAAVRLSAGLRAVFIANASVERVLAGSETARH